VVPIPARTVARWGIDYLNARTARAGRIIIGGEDSEKTVEPEARDRLIPEKSRALARRSIEARCHRVGPFVCRCALQKICAARSGHFWERRCPLRLVPHRIHQSPRRNDVEIRAGYDIAFQCLQETPMTLALSIEPVRERDLLGDHVIRFTPDVPSRNYVDMFGNTCTRIVAPAGLIEIRNEFLIFDSGLPDEVVLEARQLDVAELPDDVLVYLLGSRYCDTQKLSDLAWSQFGQVMPGWQRVQAICDYAHQRIAFGYHHARCDRTAFEGHEECVGVCRDFAHLAVTLCRCMNIPARYCTGYLGDIGVPVDPAPMDFSAWFEVFLGGRWYTFDARHNHPRIGRIVMARGRDAADVAISTTFGVAQLVRFAVITEEVVSVPGQVSQAA
jgi:transglutaminase-like putative cysteine protease